MVAETSVFRPSDQSFGASNILPFADQSSGRPTNADGAQMDEERPSNESSDDTTGYSQEEEESFEEETLPEVPEPTSSR